MHFCNYDYFAFMPSFALFNFGEVHLDWIAGSTVLLVQPIKFLICDVAVAVPIVICCQDSLRIMLENGQRDCHAKAKFC